MKRKRATIGDRKYELEWCAGIPLDECGDCDLDNADMRREFFPITKIEAARERARELLSSDKDAFGAISITLIEFVPYDDDDADAMPNVGYWTAVQDSEIIEREP